MSKTLAHSRVVAAHTGNPSTLGGRGRGISEFEASLVYRVSSRTARATQRNPVWKKKYIISYNFLFFVFWIWFSDRVSQYSLGCPGTHSVDQAGLELRNLSASASQSAGITGVCHHHPATCLVIIY